MNSLIKKATKFLLNKRKRKRWLQVVTSLAMVVVFTTTYLLILPAITIERKAICGIEEHSHTKKCYVEMKEFVCGEEDDPDHKHDSDCYEVIEEIMCDMEEHVHDDDCFETEEKEEKDPTDGRKSNDLVTDNEGENSDEPDVKFDSEIDFSHDRNNSGSGNKKNDADTDNNDVTDDVTDDEKSDEMDDVIEDIGSVTVSPMSTPETDGGRTPSKGGAGSKSDADDPDEAEEEPTELPLATPSPFDNSVPRCGLPRHKHSDVCYNLAGDLICGVEEHAHNNRCYTSEHSIMLLAAIPMEGTVNGNLKWKLALNASGDYTLSLSSSNGMVAKVPSNIFDLDENLSLYRDAVSKVCIAKTINGIEHEAFKDIKSIMYVEFEENSNMLGYIDYGAFANCTALKYINLEECTGLLWIGFNGWFGSFNDNEGAFVNSGLTTLKLPASLTGINRNAFNNCDSLVNVEFAPDCKAMYFGIGSFSQCDKLESINLENLTNNNIIFEYANNVSAFNNNVSLRSVTVPGGAYCGSLNGSNFGMCNMFIRCSSLKNITFLPNSHDNGQVNNINYMVQYTSVDVLDLRPLYNMTHLRANSIRGDSINTLIIPKSVTDIEKNAVNGCKALTTVIFEEGSNLYTFNESSFANNPVLTNIDFSGLEHLYSIDDYAFDGCTLLERIELPDYVGKVGSKAFRNCSSLKEVVFNATWYDDIMASDAFEGAGKYKLIFGSNLTHDNIYLIPSYAMKVLLDNCKSISFEPNIFFYIDTRGTDYSHDKSSTGLPAPFEETGRYFTDDQGNLYKGYYYYGHSKLVYANKELTDIHISTDRVDFGNNDYYDLTEIGSYAFDGSAATSVTIDNTAHIVLNEYAFANATKLASINGATDVVSAAALFGNSVPGTAFINTALQGAPEDVEFENAEQADVNEIIQILDEEGKDLISLAVSHINQNKKYYVEGEDEYYYDGEYYTGNMAMISASVSNLHDDAVYRIYIQVDDTDSNIRLEYIDVEGIEFELKRVEGTNIYYYDFQTGGVDQTINPKIQVGYRNGHAPGDIQVWAARIDAEDVPFLEGRVINPGEKVLKSRTTTEYYNLEWITKRQEFNVSKSWNGANEVAFIRDSEAGVNTISGLQYEIKYTGEGEDTLNVGDDLVQYVDFRDTLTLPEGVSWREGVLSGEYRYVLNGGGGASVYVTVGTKEYLLCELTDFGTISRIAVEPAEDGENLTIMWRVINTSLNTNSPSEISATNPGAMIAFGTSVLAASNEVVRADRVDITNYISSDTYYTFTEHVVKSAMASHSFSKGEGSVVFSKEMLNIPTHMNEDVQYKLVFENPSAYDYDGITKFTDYLSRDNRLQYIEAKEIERLLNSEDGKGLEIVIDHAALTVPVDTTATAIDGEAKVRLTAQNTSTAQWSDETQQYNWLAREDYSLITNNAKITIKKQDDNIRIEYSYDGNTKTVIVDKDYPDVQSALEAIGYIVTGEDLYTLNWDYTGFDFVLNGGEKKEIIFNAKLKTSLMYLPQKTSSIKDGGDQSYYYQYATPVGNVQVEFWNTAQRQLEDGSFEEKKSPVTKAGLDLEIYKWAIVNGQRLDNNVHVEEGDVFNYVLHAKHHGNGTYETLPVVDHMTGRQAIAALVDENLGAPWASKAEKYTHTDGTQYYILNQEYTYKGVWLNGFYADNITVRKINGGLDSVIKFYLKDTLPGDYDIFINYNAICSIEHANGDPDANSYSINNEVWLNDYPTHRIYAPLTGGGAYLGFDKRILETRGNDPTWDFLDEDDALPVSKDKNVVTYRLELENHYNVGTYISGDQMYDMLPETGEAFDWSKANISAIEYVATDGVKLEYAGGEHIFKGYDSFTIEDKSEWFINDLNPKSVSDEDLKAPGQWYLKWNSDVKIEFPANSHMYMYMTVRFTDTNEEWENFVNAKGTSILNNTYYVFGMPETVTHTLVDPGKVLLQKGVYEIGHYMANTNGDACDSYYVDADRYHYADTPAKGYTVKNTVTYYAIIRNSGKTPLYLEPFYDVLPEGFSFQSLKTGSKSSSANNQWVGTTGGVNPAETHSGMISDRSSTFALTDYYPGIDYRELMKYYRAGLVTYTSGGKTADGRQILKFDLAAKTGGGSETPLKYDENVGKYYLEPNTFTQFGYTCYTGDANIEKATNSIVMEYNSELNGTEVSQDLDTEVTVSNVNGKNNNDGTRDVWSNSEAAAAGYGSIKTTTENPKWLASSVDVVHGSITPGITKTVKEPMVDKEKPVADWTITMHNNGTAPMKGYTVEDTVDTPFRIRGNVTYSLWNNERNRYGSRYLYMCAGAYPYSSNGSGDLVTDGTNNKGLLFRIDDDEQGRTDRVKLSYLDSNGTLVSSELIYGETLTIPGSHYTFAWFATGRFTDPVTVQLLKGEDERETLRIGFSENWMITENSYGLLNIQTVSTKEEIDTGVYINNAKLLPDDTDYDAARITQGKNLTNDGKNIGVESSAPVSLYEGSPSSAVKEIHEVLNPDNNGRSDDFNHNHIMLADKTKEFTYTLTVNNVNNSPMSQLVLIDNLPFVGDSNPIRDGIMRDSEFQVRFADNMNIVVQAGDIVLKEEDIAAGNDKINYTVVDPSKYTIEYSDKQSGFDGMDWRGYRNGIDWSTTRSATSRSIRLTISDESIVKAQTSVQLKFNAIIDSGEGIPEAKPGQIAWNSFGYRYEVDGLPSMAAPLNVGISIPAVPYIVKSVVTANGNPSPVEEDKTFRFVIYDGDSINMTDYSEAGVGSKLAGRSFTVAEATVKAGKSVSDEIMLEKFKKYSFDSSSGKFTPTGDEWTWEDGKSYNIVELDNDYIYRATNDLAGQRNYTFTYSIKKNVKIAFDNSKPDWGILLRKTDENDKSLEGALFGIYSPYKGEAMTDAAFAATGIEQEYAQRTKDDITYYLMGLSTTPASGLISWSGLSENSYAVYEIKAPSGYMPNDELYIFNRSDIKDGNTIQSVVVNRPGTPLPETGGMGLKELFIWLGLMCYLLCFAHIGYRYIRRRVV